MKKKLRKQGQGKFKFVNLIVTESSSQQTSGYLKQDF